MKLVFCHNPDRSYCGLVDVVSKYIETYVWDKSTKSFYDMMDEIQPNKVLGLSSDMQDYIHRHNEFPKVDFCPLPAIKIAANLFNFPIEESPTHKSDLLIIGEQSAHLDFINKFVVEGRKIVIGGCPYPVPEYIGQTNFENTVRFIDNTKLVMAFNLQAVYNIAARGKYVLTPIDNPFFPSIQLNVTPYLDDLSNWVKRSQKQALEQTYYHRAAELFGVLFKTKTLVKEVYDDIEKIRDSGKSPR